MGALTKGQVPSSFKQVKLERGGAQLGFQAPGKGVSLTTRALSTSGGRRTHPPRRAKARIVRVPSPPWAISRMLPEPEPLSFRIRSDRREPHGGQVLDGAPWGQ